MRTDRRLRGAMAWAQRRVAVLCGLVLFLAAPVQAEWYLAADVLQARYAGPAVDGTWKQDLIPHGSELDGTSLSYDAGIGYRFTGGESAWTQLWSMELGYRNWGSVTAGGKWVSDEDYTSVMQHGARWLTEHCIAAPYASVTDRVQGGYLRMAKGFDVGYGFEPFVSAGVFAAVHNLSVGSNSSPILSGVVAGPSVGGGVKYALYQGVKARVGAESNWTMTESGHPISSQWLTVGGGVEVPLVW